MKILIIFLKVFWYLFIIKIFFVVYKFINGFELSFVSYIELEGRIFILR